MINITKQILKIIFGNINKTNQTPICLYQHNLYLNLTTLFHSSNDGIFLCYMVITHKV